MAKKIKPVGLIMWKGKPLPPIRGGADTTREQAK